MITAAPAGILEHSKANAKLKQGLERLGLHCGEIPRNSSRGHDCGHCSFGCAHGDKQDATATFLADAVQAGARIITGIDPLLPAAVFVRVLMASVLQVVRLGSSRVLGVRH